MSTRRNLAGVVILAAACLIGAVLTASPADGQSLTVTAGVADSKRQANGPTCGSSNEGDLVISTWNAINTKPEIVDNFGDNGTPYLGYAIGQQQDSPYWRGYWHCQGDGHEIYYKIQYRIREDKPDLVIFFRECIVDFDASGDWCGPDQIPGGIFPDDYRHGANQCFAPGTCLGVRP